LNIGLKKHVWSEIYWFCWWGINFAGGGFVLVVAAGDFLLAGGGSVFWRWIYFTGDEITLLEAGGPKPS
jgi:hypothetical protein